MKLPAMLACNATIALMLTGCNAAPPAAVNVADTHDADAKAINDSETQWNKDWAAKDADKILSHYSDDAILMAPGNEPAAGKDAIRPVLKQMLQDNALSLQFQASKTDVSKSGDLAYTAGTYKLTVTDPVTHKVIHDHGTYVTNYHKQPDGSWKAVADIASSSVPQGPPVKSK